MRVRREFIAALCSLFIFSMSWAEENPRRAAAKGLDYYNSQEYDKALAEFLAGLQAAPDRNELRYDLGTALYKMEDFENAAKAFGSATGGEEQELTTDSWFNLGNAMLRGGKVDEAIASYKNALRLNHNDLDSKHNLEMALMMKKMMQQQQQQSSDGQDSTDQQQPPPEQQQTQQDSTGQQQQQTQAADSTSASQDSTRQAEPDEEKDGMSEEEALRLLQALESDEQEAQKEKLKRQFGQQPKAEKDW